MTDIENNNNCQEKKKCHGHGLALVCNLIMLAAIVVLYVLHFSGNKTDAQTSAATNEPVVAGEGRQLTIAYVNTDSINAKYEYAQDLEKEVKAYQKNKENSYQQQMTQFQNDYQNYLKTGDQLTLAQQQAKETELKQRAEKLANLEQQLAMQVQQKLMDENQKMLDAVYQYIEKYNTADAKYDLIFTQSILLYGNEAMDITDEIIEGLNEEYRATKNNKK